MTARILGVLLVVLTLFAVAAACGGSEENETSKQTLTSGQAQSVDVEQDDYYFNPKELSTDLGKVITVKLKNQGKVAHTFTIDELGVTQTVQPGQEATVTFTPTKGGTFAFYCKFHRQSNSMEGALKVSGGAGGALPGGSTPGTGSGGGYAGGGGY